MIILESIWRFILEKVTYLNRLFFQNRHFNLKYYIQGYQIQILEISSFFVKNQEFIRSSFFRNQEIFLWGLRDIHWFLWDTIQLSSVYTYFFYRNYVLERWNNVISNRKDASIFYSCTYFLSRIMKINGKNDYFCRNYALERWNNVNNKKKDASIFCIHLHSLSEE